jgi:hypothetical protein
MIVLLSLLLLLLLALVFQLRPKLTNTFSLISKANLSFFFSLSPVQVYMFITIFSFFLSLFRRRARRTKKKREKDNHQFFLIIKYIKFILSLPIYYFRSDNFTSSSLFLDRRRSLSLCITNRKIVSFAGLLLLTRHTQI